MKHQGKIPWQLDISYVFKKGRNIMKKTLLKLIAVALVVGMIHQSILADGWLGDTVAAPFDATASAFNDEHEWHHEKRQRERAEREQQQQKQPENRRQARRERRKTSQSTKKQKTTKKSNGNSSSTSTRTSTTRVEE
jgi:hypothetical protein